MRLCPPYEASERGCQHSPLNIVVASAAKQSTVPPRRQTGLLRCARNDGVCSGDAPPSRVPDALQRATLLR